jgi:hypothetical protein
LGRQRHELLTPVVKESILCNEERAGAQFHGIRKRRYQFRIRTGAEENDLSLYRACSVLKNAQLKIDIRKLRVYQCGNRRGPCLTRINKSRCNMFLFVSRSRPSWPGVP